MDIQTYSNQGLIKWRQNKKSNRDGFVDFNNPDFVKYAESFGAMGNQVCPVWTTQNNIEGSQVEEFNVMVPGAKATGRVEVT